MPPEKGGLKSSCAPCSSRHPRGSPCQASTRVRAADLDGLVVTHLPNIFYLTNFLGTAGIAVAMRDRLYLDSRFPVRSAAKESGTRLRCPDAEIVPVERTYDETLVALIKKLQPKRLGIEGSQCRSIARISCSHAQHVGDRRMSSTHPLPVSTDGVVERLRIIKDAHEIDMLRRGAQLLSPVAVDIIDDVKPGMKEQELAAKIDWRIKSAGFERCSFETIVASGPNSALPHAHPGERVLREGDLVVLDFGGVYGGYCVDLTRTVAVGEPDAEMAAGLSRRYSRPRRRPSRRSSLASGRGISTRRPGRRWRGMGWPRPSGTARATAWAWKFTKRRGLDHDERRSATRRRRQTKRSSLEWSSPSSRAPISRDGAACGSKTTCW